MTEKYDCKIIQDKPNEKNNPRTGTKKYCKGTIYVQSSSKIYPSHTSLFLSQAFDVLSIPSHSNTSFKIPLYIYASEALYTQKWILTMILYFIDKMSKTYGFTQNNQKDLCDIHVIYGHIIFKQKNKNR